MTFMNAGSVIITGKPRANYTVKTDYRDGARLGRERSDNTSVISGTHVMKGEDMLLQMVL